MKHEWLMTNGGGSEGGGRITNSDEMPWIITNATAKNADDLP